MAQRASVHVLECHVYRVSIEECIVQVHLRTREYSRAVLYSVAARCTLLQRAVPRRVARALHEYLLSAASAVGRVPPPPHPPLPPCVARLAADHRRAGRS